VLKTFAGLACEELRSYDCVSRWGGEEFLVMMPGADSAAAHAAIERLRAACARLQWPAISPSMQVTFSAGVSTMQPVVESPEALVERADRAMYAAKEAGRDRVCISRASYMPQRSTGVWTGASHKDSVEASTAHTVSEQPAISSEVT
jgi:diguanylate cyclase (GGDEF)-like protein